MSICPRSSPRTVGAAFSKCTPKTTWARGGDRTTPSNAFDATFPSRCTEFVCRSGGPEPLDVAHLELFARSLNAMSRQWSRNIWRGRRTRAPISMICCRCRNTEATLVRLGAPIGRRILLENPSSYVVFRESTMSETDLLRELTRHTGCGLLLDVNNVFVSATNLGRSALDYLSDFPIEHVGEVHLAGHAEQTDDEGERLLIDSHDGPVADAVWKPFEILVSRRGSLPTLVEWDSNIPEWAVLTAEATAA